MRRMTVEEVIKNHRKMWNWIADESEKRGYKVYKTDYFMEHPYLEYVYSKCYCCDYVHELANYRMVAANCFDSCPIEWGSELFVGVNHCNMEGSPFHKIFEDWVPLKEYIHRCRTIANLPIKNRENISDYNEEESQ